MNITFPSKKFPLFLVLLSLLGFGPTRGEQQTTTTTEMWYPFVKEGKWGFIDKEGNWKIQPMYDAICNVFDKDIVRVWVNKKWGYIDRRGNWIVQPQFNQPAYVVSDFTNGYQVVGSDTKEGILAQDGHLVIAPQYDEVALSKDRAWVRVGKYIGVMGLNGKWIHKPNILWGADNALPGPVNSDGVAWFLRTDGDEDGVEVWGLISADGTVLFSAIFDAHSIPKDEFEPEDGPVFQDGRVWVDVGGADGEVWLISNDGTVIARKPFTSVSRWSDTLSQFSDKKGSGLVSNNSGTIAFYGEGVEIRSLHEGVGVFTRSISTQTATGEWSSDTTSGVLSSEGRIIVPLGTYYSIADFHEGIAAAVRNKPYQPYRSGFIDKNGQESIPFIYCQVKSFSNGLAAVGKRDPNNVYCWRYIDTNGKEQVSQGYASVTPFYRDRAWACETSDGTGRAVYAMIDRTGKSLTDFRFIPPDMYNGNAYQPEDIQLKSRWIGNLVVLIGGNKNGGYGLASTDGKILQEPRFNGIGQLSDGMISAVTWDGQIRKMGYVNDKGEMAIPAIYSFANDFSSGSAWVTNVMDHHNGQIDNPGWMLIDHQGRLLTDDAYDDPMFIFPIDFHDHTGPKFYDDLACVYIPRKNQSFAQDRMLHSDWGYVNHAGRIVAWHKAE